MKEKNEKMRFLWATLINNLVSYVVPWYTQQTGNATIWCGKKYYNDLQSCNS